MLYSNLVGNTPLVSLGNEIYAKMEAYNPSGSVKDRIVNYILNDAFRNKKLKEGDTIVEATSGNTGISVSMFGAARGCKVKIVMPRNMSEERKQMMRLFGADIIEVGESDFDGAIELRNKLAKENGWFNLNQFHNPLNIECHYETTGKEIFHQLIDLHGSRNISPYSVSALILGTGTGGTLMGVGKRLREFFSDMKLVVIEPAESPVMSGGEPGVHGIQGIADGSKFLVDMEQVNDIEVVSTEDAENRARSLIRGGLLVGISSGANVLGAERWVKRNRPRGAVITMLCDRGERYCSVL